MIYVILAAIVIVALICAVSRSNVPYSDSNPPPPPPPPRREPSSVQWEKNRFINKRIHQNDARHQRHKQNQWPL